MHQLRAIKNGNVDPARHAVNCVHVRRRTYVDRDQAERAAQRIVGDRDVLHPSARNVDVLLVERAPRELQLVADDVQTIVVPGAGFLLNNEMGDFNAGPGLTDERGLIGTEPNLAKPGKRMLSSMTPTIVAKDGQLFMVTGSPGGRTIINTVLMTLLDVIDFGMNAQEAVDAGRIHHQWLPDRISYEKFGFSADTLKLLQGMGHTLQESDTQGVAEVIVVGKDGVLEGGVDRRAPDGGAAGK